MGGEKPNYAGRQLLRVERELERTNIINISNKLTGI